ncbi:hypothetical protein JCM8202_001631 [Rhodotorula sphaerocarpa]
MFSAARWRVPLVRQASAAPAAAAPRLAAPPPRIPAANNLTAASLSTSSPAHASVKAKHAERRDKVQRRQTAREKRREKEERRDEALQQHNELQQAETRSKRTTGYEIREHVPELSEEQLEAMYQSLMDATPEDFALPALAASQAPALPDPFADAQSRRERVERLASRLDGFQDELGGPTDETSPDGALSMRLRQRREDAEAGEEVPPLTSLEIASPARTIIDRLEHDLAVSAPRKDASDGTPTTVKVPRGLLTRPDYEDLVLSSALEGDRDGVLRGLAVMKTAVAINEGNVLEETLAIYASQGRAQDALAVASYARQNGLPLSVAAHHHLLVTVLPTHPELAVQHLRSMEAAGHTPLPATYTAVIKRLLSPASPPHLVREGWDLFGHSRLVAHPVPDVPLYSTMIQACAHGAHPSPERAIDLFVEMTDDHRLPPSELAYNGVIRACAREGSREYYFEALRYMRRMLDENVAPSRHTFHALLEGARRHGDLARARWMLVKMIAVGAESSPNETTLALLLQTYAAYKPAPLAAPVEPNVSLQEQRPSTDASREETVDDPDARSRPSSTLEAKDDPARLAHGIPGARASGARHIVELLGEASLFYPGPMPQTSAEVLAEARNLMLQVVDAARLEGTDAALRGNPAPPASLFEGVEPSVFLLNSYLAVLNSHAPFAAALDFFAGAFDRAGIAKNRYSYELVLRRCELARNKDAAGEGAKKIWEEWLVWSEAPLPAVRSDAEGSSTDVGGLRREAEEWAQERRNGRHVSKMWGGLIRILAKSFREEEALAVLKRFRQAYPPQTLRRDITPEAASTGALAGPTDNVATSASLPPLPIRLSSPLYPETAPSVDPLRPPYLLFKDLRVLHHRLADVENKAGLAVVTGVAKAYETALAAARRSERRKEGGRR